jgi:aspartyl-tRNA(Asn)/glutamyl-tRNA(Gln) amidotransferase subunit B
MRSKETSEDYRYFPEPDLPPLHVEPAWIERVRTGLPELPAARRARYVALGITGYDASVIVADPAKIEGFEAIAAADERLPVKEIANFVTGQYARALKETGQVSGLVGRSSAADLAALLRAIVDGHVSRTAGRDLIERHLWSATPASELLANAVAPDVMSDAVLAKVVDDLIAANPKAVADYHAGRPVTGFFVGKVMKATAGAADAARVTTLVRERLGPPAGGEGGAA